MTLEQGLISLKAKMAQGNATPDNQVATKLDEEGVELPEGEQPVEQQEADTDSQENAESVSEADQEADVEIPLNGKISMPDGSTITAEEARKGYLRQSDFTRKTTEIAREREALAAREQAAVQHLGGLYQQVASLQEMEPNWLQLANDPNVDPKQLQAAQLQWQHRKGVLAETKRTMEAHQAQARQVRMAKAFETLSSGEFDPAWKDSKSLQKGLSTVSEYLAERGVPQELIESVDHHVLIEIAEESRRYRELNNAKPKAALAVKGKPLPFKPGAKSTATPQTEAVRQMEEVYRKNPSIDNAVQLEKARAANRR